MGHSLVRMGHHDYGPGVIAAVCLGKLGDSLCECGKVCSASTEVRSRLFHAFYLLGQDVRVMSEGLCDKIKNK